MKRTILLSLALFVCILSNAQWNSNTANNLALSSLNAADLITKETTTGKTYIAFYSSNGSNYDMRAQLLDSNGVKLFGNDGILVSDRKSGSATFVFNACVDKDNNFIITFQYQRQGGVHEIVAYKIDSLGNSLWGKDGIALGEGLAPYPCTLKNSDIIVAWQTDSNTVSYQRIDNTGRRLWNPAKTITSPTGAFTPQVVSNSIKSFSIVYQIPFFTFYTHLYAQKFDKDGNALWTSPVQLSNCTTTDYHFYSVLAVADTTYVGYYANPPSQNRFDGFLQRINPDGTLPWNVNGSLFTTYSTESQPITFEVNIAHKHDDPNIWAVGTMSDPNQVNYGISVQSFSMATGERQLGNHAKTIFEISDTAYQQKGRLLLCQGQPLFMFTDAGNELYATELDSNGNFAWPDKKLVLGSSAKEKGRFAFTKKPSTEEAIAVWQEDKGSGDMAYAQNVTCDGQTGVLPVTLLNFHGMYNNGVSNLYWQTSQEINNTGFELQRSTDGSIFSKITFVATLAPNGNSVQPLNYSYTDIKIPSGNIYYRLKQIDKDGKSTYSSTLLIKSLAKPGMSIYPNPVAGSLNINFNSSVNTQTTIVVTDMLGRILLQQTQSIFSGDNALRINCASLKPGLYFLKSQGSNGTPAYLQKFVKQ